jgi:hypothetical protein
MNNQLGKMIYFMYAFFNDLNTLQWFCVCVCARFVWCEVSAARACVRVSK